MEPYSHPEDRKVRVTIEASDYTCEGMVHLPGIRLSDVMNDKSQFLVVVKAVLFRRRPGAPDQRSVELETVFINKSDIRFIIPVDDARTSPILSRNLPLRGEP